MLTQSRTVKTLTASAALIAGLGLGAVLGSPGVAQAQEDTTTTVAEDSTEAMKTVTMPQRRLTPRSPAEPPPAIGDLQGHSRP